MSFWDGLLTDSRCQVMIVGATNRPQDVDAAILRRMPSMFYIGLPVSYYFAFGIGQTCLNHWLHQGLNLK